VAQLLRSDVADGMTIDCGRSLKAAVRRWRANDAEGALNRSRVTIPCDRQLLGAVPSMSSNRKDF